MVTGGFTFPGFPANLHLVHALDQCLGTQDKTMDADIQIHALHILRNYIVPLFYQSVCLCHADECDHTSS